MNTLPFDAPFVPNSTDIRYTPQGVLPARDLNDVLTLLPDGSYEPRF